jgi:DNA-binding LacI/PurR family transcriptional regulator
VSVPGDVSVCAVAGAGVSAPDGRRLTQSRFDFIDMGRQAVELLRLRCECPTDALPPAIHRIGYEFQEGNTVTAVNGYGKERKA